MDYRDIQGSFNRIVSIGMFEHVGPKNYTSFMNTAYRCLENNGLFLLHTIGGNRPTALADDWIHNYIFPNGVLPTMAQICVASQPLFITEDWHNFGPYYDQTLMAWHQNFIEHWDTLKERYSERFYRMWNFYLLSCAGAFRARDMQLWQIVFSKGRREGVYSAPR